MTSFDRCHLPPSGDNDQQPTQNTEYENLGLKTFGFTEHKLQDKEKDIDPENFFFFV